MRSHHDTEAQPPATRGATRAIASQHRDLDAPSWLQRTPFWRLKVRLQFIGWLQYVAPLAAAAPLLVLAGAGALIGALPVLLVWTPLVLGLVLLLVAAVDLVTVRWNIRPQEPHPPRLDGADAFEVMRARRATRSFQHRMLTAECR